MFVKTIVFALFLSVNITTFAQQASSDKQAEQTPAKVEAAKPTESQNDAAIEINPPIAESQQQVNDIKHFVAESSIVSLLAGTDEVVTLLKTNTTANNKGVAILLPEWHKVATNPTAMTSLMQQLPDLGWTSILVQPPEAPANYPSTQRNKTAANEENKTNIEAYQQKLSVMMQAVMQKAADFPGAFVVIAQGENGALLLQLYQSGKNQPPAALVLLSSYRSTETGNQAFIQALANSSFPVLDLALTRDTPLVQANLKAKLAATKKSLKVFYRQQQLFNFQTGYYPPASLMKAINGWLKTIGF